MLSSRSLVGPTRARWRMILDKFTTPMFFRSMSISMEGTLVFVA